MLAWATALLNCRAGRPPPRGKGLPPALFFFRAGGAPPSLGRDLEAKNCSGVSGEERGGKLHFMNQPDGGNYLAVSCSGVIGQAGTT